MSATYIFAYRNAPATNSAMAMVKKETAAKGTRQMVLQ